MWHVLFLVKEGIQVLSRFRSLNQLSVVKGIYRLKWYRVSIHLYGCAQLFLHHFGLIFLLFLLFFKFLSFISELLELLVWFFPDFVIIVSEIWNFFGIWTAIWWISLLLLRNWLHFLFLCHHVNQWLNRWTRLLIVAILNMQRWDIAPLGLFFLYAHLLDRVWNDRRLPFMNFPHTLSRFLTSFIIVLFDFLVYIQSELVAAFTHHLALVMLRVYLAL